MTEDVRYFGLFKNYAQMKTEWGKIVQEPFPNEDEVLFATYGGLSYAGDAVVIFEHAGKLYEVHGRHCSCYGLESCSYEGDSESQWSPEETTWEALEMREWDAEEHDAEAILAFKNLVKTKKPPLVGA